MSNKRLLIGLVAALALFVVVPQAGAQCAMCRTALESSADARALIEKLNLGIILLLAAPFGIAVAVGVAMAKSRRRLMAAEAPHLPLTAPFS